MLKRTEPRAFFWVAPAIAIAGAGLLIYWTGRARPLWLDEEMLGLNVRSRGFADLAGALWLDQSAPLGWLALERLVMVVFGTGERSVRLLTTVFGSGTLVVAVWIGRRWMNALGAAVLVSLCAFSEWVIFFTLESKHYSADTFWALGVPALAAWAIEPGDSSLLRRRLALWWVATAIGIWFGNGAVFVAPACAVVLLVMTLRRGGWRLASWFAAVGFIWLGSFALSYLLVLRHALANAYMRNYWAFAFPPVSEGAAATFRWMIAELEPFAGKPASSGLWRMFWLAWAGGIAFAVLRRRALGLMFATVPISAVLLAIAHVIPIFERLTLWAVPGLYVGIALCADGAVWLAARPASRGRPLALACAIVAGVLSVTVCLDVVRLGLRAQTYRDPHSNYGLDDRSSVRWLLEAHRAGDVILTTHYGLVAIWWYSGMDVSDPDRSGHLPDGTPMFELGHVDGADCGPAERQLGNLLAVHPRAVVYLGFRLNVLPIGFDNLAFKELGQRGELTAYKPFADKSRLAVFTVGRPSARELLLPEQQSAPDPIVPEGCLSITPARRW
jgi:hypothetical protein